MNAVRNKRVALQVLGGAVALISAFVFAKESLPTYESIELQARFRDSRELVSLTLQCALQSGTDQARKPNKYYGTDGEPLRCLTNSLIVAVGKNPIRISTDFFNDLGNVHIPKGVWLSKSENYLVIHIDGGDGAGSYKARVFLASRSAQYREIDEVDESGEKRTHIDIDKRRPVTKKMH